MTTTLVLDLYENPRDGLVGYLGDADLSEKFAELLRWRVLHVEDSEGVRSYGRVRVVIEQIELPNRVQIAGRDVGAGED